MLGLGLGVGSGFVPSYCNYYNKNIVCTGGTGL